jgi:hypothetical protein
MPDLPKGVASVLFLPPNPGRHKWACSIVFYFDGERLIAIGRGDSIMQAFDLGCREASRLMAARLDQGNPEDMGESGGDLDAWPDDDDDDDDASEASIGLSRLQLPDQNDAGRVDRENWLEEERRIHQEEHPTWPLPNHLTNLPPSLN